MMCPSDSTQQAHSPMTEASRTRSDSLEASSSQQERKRPRLDSGYNVGLGSEEALTDSVFPEASQDPDSSDTKPTGATCLSNSSSPSPPKMEPSSHGPLSKVTINTRSAANNASDAACSSFEQSEDIPTPQKSPAAASTTSVNSARSTDMVAVTPHTAVIQSSPSQSPTIQVAVVEDIDQDPAETNWTPVTRLTNSFLLQEQATPHYVSRTFPYAQRTPAGFIHEILTEMGKLFLQGLLAMLRHMQRANLGSRRRWRRTHLH